MGKKYIVNLKRAEQEMLTGLIVSRTQLVRKINHAHILLKVDDGWTDQKIREALNVSVPTIERVRQHFVEEGIHQALSPRKTRSKYQHLMDGVQEAYLLALACSQPLKRHRRWSLRLLASEMIRFEYIEDVSRATIRHVMQDNELKLCSKKNGVFLQSRTPSSSIAKKMYRKSTNTLKMLASH